MHRDRLPGRLLRGRLRQAHEAFILALLVAPLLVSYMLRMLAWVGLLSPGVGQRGSGSAAHRSARIRLAGRPAGDRHLGLIYGWIPYFIIPLYASLARFDTRYLEASRDLGAGTFGRFFT